MTHTDPSADAFMRRILSNPADALPRLVFADWLEESGTSSNLAWARYLRLADELANAPPDDERRPKMEAELAKIGSLIRARLRCRAEVVVAYPDAMLQLLPARNLIVKLDSVMVPPAVLEFIPESVARESLVLPLAQLADGTVVLAAPEPPGRLVERLEFILNRRVVFVGVIDPDLTDCFNHNYGNTETETVDSVTYLWLPDDGLQGGPPGLVGDPTVALWNQVILDAVTYIATAVQLDLEADQLTVWHHFNDVRRQHDLYFPVANEFVPRLVPLLRLFLRNSLITPEGTTTGEITVAFWGRPRTHSVQITERPNGYSVLISIPPYPTGLSVALNPAA